MRTIGPCRSRVVLIATLFLGFLSRSGAFAADPADVERFLEKIRSRNAAVRSAATRRAPEIGASVVVSLGALAASDNVGVARAAIQSLRAITHHAGRPDAGDERLAIEGELIKLLGDGRPIRIRAKVCDLLSFIGGADSAAVLGSLLADSALRERARCALERIPDVAATRALIDAYNDAPDAFKPSLVQTLGQRRATEAAGLLTDALASDETSIALAAADALARIGVRPVRRFEASALATLTVAEHRRLTTAFLRWADHRARLGDGKRAMLTYGRILDRAEADHLRCAAIIGMADLGRVAFPIIALHLTDLDSTVRAAATTALIQMEGAQINALLEARLESARPDLRAAVLRVLTYRSAPNATELLEAAAKDGNAEVRVTAYELLGRLNQPALEPTLLEAAEWGSPEIQSVALTGYIHLAGAKLSADERLAARRMYHRALDLARTSDLANQALRGLGVIASLNSAVRVRRAMDDESTADAAALAYIEIAAVFGARKKADTDKAVAMIHEAVRSSASRDVMDTALARLKSLGVDTVDFTRTVGFITDWWLIGPFPNPQKSAYERAFFPEGRVDLKGLGAVDGRTLIWKKTIADAVPARLDLAEQFRPNTEVACYAYSTIDSPSARDIHLRIGTDDGCVVWLNGRRIYGTNAERGFVLDQDIVKARLKKGENALLVKVLQSGGGWEMCVRITDDLNRPLDLTAWK